MNLHFQRVRTTAIIVGIFSALVVQASEQSGAIVFPAEPIVLCDITFDADYGLVTLRWSSQAGKTYAIEETANPELGWEQNTAGIPGGSPETIWTVPLLPENEGAKSMLFRVSELGESAEVDAAGENDLNPKGSGQSSASLNSPRKGTALIVSSDPPNGGLLIGPSAGPLKKEAATPKESPSENFTALKFIEPFLGGG